MNPKEPYLSIIAVGRNDNYEINFLERVQNFLNNLSYLCNKYKFFSELIFVEWNPPDNKKKLYQALKLKNNNFLKVRFIEVPKKIHESFENSDKIPLFEFIGKNVGIRRSHGDFILVTNPDIIFNEEVFEFLSKKILERKKVYRIDRHEINFKIPIYKEEGDLIKLLGQRVTYKTGVLFNKQENLLKQSKEYIKSFTKILLAKINPQKYSYLCYWGGPAGDFLIMSKEDWIKIEGYPEIRLIGGADNYLLLRALQEKIKIQVLLPPLKIFHQMHTRKENLVRPHPTKNMKNNYLSKFRGKHKIIFNKKNWGLKNKKLKEKIL